MEEFREHGFSVIDTRSATWVAFELDCHGVDFSRGQTPSAHLVEHLGVGRPLCHSLYMRTCAR